MRILIAVNVDAERRASRERCLSGAYQSRISGLLAVANEVNDSWLGHSRSFLRALG